MHNDVEWQELKLKLMTHYWHTWAILNIYLNLLFRLGHKHVIIMLDYLWKHDGYLSNFPTYKNCDKIQYEGGVFFTFATCLFLSKFYKGIMGSSDSWKWWFLLWVDCIKWSI